MHSVRHWSLAIISNVRLFILILRPLLYDTGHNLPFSVSHLRATYLRDVNFMMDTLNGLGRELKAYPGVL